MRQTNTQLSLRNRAVWLESSFPYEESLHPWLSKVAQWRFWSAAQSDLNLRWAHMSKLTFPDVAVLLIIVRN